MRISKSLLGVVFAALLAVPSIAHAQSCAREDSTFTKHLDNHPDVGNRAEFKGWLNSMRRELNRLMKCFKGMGEQGHPVQAMFRIGDVTERFGASLGRLQPPSDAAPAKARRFRKKMVQQEKKMLKLAASFYGKASGFRGDGKMQMDDDVATWQGRARSAQSHAKQRLHELKR